MKIPPYFCLMDKKEKIGFIERTVLKLRREYSKDELVAHLNKQISEKDVEIGKLKAFITELEANIANLENLDKKEGKILSKVDERVIALEKRNRKLSDKNKRLENKVNSLLYKLYGPDMYKV